MRLSGGFCRSLRAFRFLSVLCGLSWRGDHYLVLCEVFPESLLNHLRRFLRALLRDKRRDIHKHYPGEDQHREDDAGREHDYGETIGTYEIDYFCVGAHFTYRMRANNDTIMTLIPATTPAVYLIAFPAKDNPWNKAQSWSIFLLVSRRI